MCFVNKKIRSIFVHSPKSEKCSVYWLLLILYCVFNLPTEWIFLAYHFVCSIEHQVVNLPFFLILIDFYIERSSPKPIHSIQIHNSTLPRSTKEKCFFLLPIFISNKIGFSPRIPNPYSILWIIIIITPNIRY